ncbi:MAG: acyl-CoA-binding protein [Candidatus Hydrogenedentes bacterium]|nr:acyl-CoA-binding protein [Candidatus Hydrogenedentota bacterium]
MSQDISAEFTQASEAVKKLSSAPDSATMLTLYGLFKQGSLGNCAGERPGMLDFVARAKFDAWKALDGISQDDAKRQYVELVQSLQAADKKH